MELDNWHQLKEFTNARIALGRAGNALPTNEVLQLRMAHALAKDAISTEIDVLNIKEDAKKIGLNIVFTQSQITNTSEYLRNPNKGRVLHDQSCTQLKEYPQKKADLCIIIADGLSAEAVNLHAMKLIEVLLPKLKIKDIGPIIVVKYGRVAISDEIGEILDSKIALILIGERPGLSSPTSMGAYITLNPKKGNTDEKRNCVSNIQRDGLPYEFAAQKLTYLIQQMVSRQISGVALKDDFTDYYVSE
ncbi:ethanolamine ammonia-lyase subunit EutC [Flavobacterium sp. Arc3]|jgi:ethanolamine ammonia-lyase small subunit|uniref:ethanolamine ammonia-lyase subunit EutC n=1 Tax=unclassified Flavobacterium TaxID=196869 RepID=UPI00352D17AD